MGCTLIKKCAICGKEMVISKNDIDMICFKGKNYHIECFKSMCNGRVLKHDRYSLIYAEALNDFASLKKETNKKILGRLIQDELNVYLLSNYNIAAFTSRFWEMIHDIQNGTYKQQKCNPVDLQILLDMWKDGQKYLNSIDSKNKQRGKHIDGEERVKYDLAILMSNYGKYVNKRNKDMAATITMSQESTTDKINYQALAKSGNYDNVDIASIVDDIF